MVIKRTATFFLCIKEAYRSRKDRKRLLPCSNKGYNMFTDKIAHVLTGWLLRLFIFPMVVITLIAEYWIFSFFFWRYFVNHLTLEPANPIYHINMDWFGVVRYHSHLNTILDSSHINKKNTYWESFTYYWEVPLGLELVKGPLHLGQDNKLITSSDPWAKEIKWAGRSGLVGSSFNLSNRRVLVISPIALIWWAMMKIIKRVNCQFCLLIFKLPSF